MTNLLTASEAFEALQMGKTILCRPEGDMLDFADLDQFPASIFGKQGYEYCIKVELIKVAGIEFTKPLTLDDVRLDQDIYLVEPTGSIYWYKFNEVPALKTAITNGFAQADIENARLQLKAFCAAVGRDVDTSESRVVPIGDADKQKTTKKKSSKSSSQKQTEVTKPVDLPENIEASLDTAVVTTEGSYVSSSEAFLTQSTNATDTKPNINAQFEILLDAIRICQSEKELDSTCANLEKEGFSQVQIDKINLAKQERLIELDFIEMDAADTASEQVFSVTEAQEIDDVVTTSMPENYESLVKTIQDAHTPEEVNSVVRYTSKWAEEQRKPLLNEMHKRLSELNQIKQQDDGLSPLIVRLQYAADLKTLEELELEIPSRHSDVHKTLWNMAKKRRSQLNAASNEPAYLLEDGL
ncbi:hypothetical protein BFR69_02710 [Acinetobacter pittii]|uniref:hypothetical protein n=1 Tax=Acinetobacter pittii TaxID=48296 RepID=UPI000838E222|nr:hypothetical protein [Acinetobacter pittii]OCZ33595.1 hypothetical protein BFR69_02710 [Acinetobacter pittii]